MYQGSILFDGSFLHESKKKTKATDRGLGVTAVVKTNIIKKYIFKKLLTESKRITLKYITNNKNKENNNNKLITD